MDRWKYSELQGQTATPGHGHRAVSGMLNIGKDAGRCSSLCCKAQTILIVRVDAGSFERFSSLAMLLSVVMELFILLRSFFFTGLVELRCHIPLGGLRYL